MFTGYGLLTHGHVFGAAFGPPCLRGRTSSIISTFHPARCQATEWHHPSCCSPIANSSACLWHPWQEVKLSCDGIPGIQLHLSRFLMHLPDLHNGFTALLMHLLKSQVIFSGCGAGSPFNMFGNQSSFVFSTEFCPNTTYRSTFYAYNWLSVRWLGWHQDILLHVL